MRRVPLIQCTAGGHEFRAARLPTLVKKKKVKKKKNWSWLVQPGVRQEPSCQFPFPLRAVVGAPWRPCVRPWGLRARCSSPRQRARWTWRARRRWRRLRASRASCVSRRATAEARSPRPPQRTVRLYTHAGGVGVGEDQRAPPSPSTQPTVGGRSTALSAGAGCCFAESWSHVDKRRDSY